jgi:drug/metabolite transporter (DMT)-like permease
MTTVKKAERVWVRAVGYTSFALIAFAANSVLCRLALGEATIDAASFTTIRLVSGALMLLLVNAAGKTEAVVDRGNWTSALMLFLYAVTFSFAYISLNTGTGALILFASVQATMIIFAIYKGERLGLMGSLGLFAALSGGLTSAIGYVIWYAALRDHSATSAALVQLLVPVLAALGGVVLLSEALTVRLLLSSAMIIGGVALALTQRKNSKHAESAE